MQYYPINLVQQKLYANENVLLTFHLITFSFNCFFKNSKIKNKREEAVIDTYSYNWVRSEVPNEVVTFLAMP